MGYFDKYHIFRDPIHGFIKVYELERDIINSNAFQRLRRIKQLGPTNLIYHGADHTRFAHSLGVMHLADRVLMTVLQKDQSGDKILKWKPEEIRKNRAMLRLVALLHDIGHGPFSHSGESGLLPENIKHEQVSAIFVTNDKNLSEILDSKVKKEFSFSSNDIANFILNKEPIPILQQIIMGPLDADKMDYLWRDSFYTGVYYGRFDVDRLIHTLTIVYDFSKERPEPSLGIEEGGVFVAEAMMLARYYMFLQVYFHEVRRAYDFHLIDFLKSILPGGKLPLNLKKYQKYDDSFVNAKLTESYYNKKSKNHKLAKIIYERNHYKKVVESSIQPTPKEKSIFKNRVDELKKNKKYKHLDFRFDPAEDAPNKFNKEPFYVRRRDTLKTRIKDKLNFAEIDEMSPMIKDQLSQIEMLRLYIRPVDNFDVIKKEIKELPWKL